MNRLFGAVFAGVLSVALIGCGQPSIPSVSYSPGAAAREAMALYDANKDGKLDASELKKCPSIAGSLAEIDTDGDKSVSEQELSARIASYATSGARLRGERARVVRGIRPISGVTVTLEPEKFMMGSIKPASGVSDDSGYVVFQSEGQPYEGMQIGFYQMILSQKDAGGKEQLPAKHNSATTHGVEIGPANRINLTLDLDK